ncbi:DnaB-like helicase N-terminal domain-containing protein [Calothrix sp. 336/3]|uniref:DnaB-like helicase N-terminal domain-containing protein n=1 Tax=Calothrix sp. 336/3 TaxID=1337936 RepID=UPI0004E4563D|nr:DnaB-like helicase N-terminal domain-containing protein [Calothrix sp. 336/3]AKG21253.1 hypothetical protein IJ00_08040 [Calothrix sp. 336/3]
MFNIDSTYSAQRPINNIDAEMAVLGSIILDSAAIYKIADKLPVDAFTLEKHQIIYKSCLELHRNQISINLLSVANILADKNLLGTVGGRSALTNLIDSIVSSAGVESATEVLLEKHTRRRLSLLSSQIEQLAHDRENPLSWTLEKLEQTVLQITGLRKHDDQGYWQKRDTVAFENLCKDLEEIEDIENAAQRDWLMRKLAKKWKFSNKKELLDFHAKWLDSQNKTYTYTAKEYFEKHGNQEQNWIFPGLIPLGSVLVAYGGAGVGKTRTAMTLAKYACAGGTFTYDGAEIEPMKTLLIETDQGARNTSKLLEMQDFFADDTVANRMVICDEWTVGEFGRLKQMLKQHEPKFVIIDSLMSVSTTSLYSENDTEYARPIIRLRHLAQEFNCTFLVIHHANAEGSVRGSRAIIASADEVWKLARTKNEIEEFNSLTIEKSRSRAPGAYKFVYDDDSWGWTFKGRIEDDIMGGNSQSASLMSRCIKFLKEKLGQAFQAEEIAEGVGSARESVRREMRRASNEGLVNVGRATGDSRKLVYYLGSRVAPVTNRTCDPTDPTETTSRIGLLPLPDKGSGRCDHVILKNQTFENAEKKVFGSHDQIGLITSPEPLPEETGTQITHLIMRDIQNGSDVETDTEKGELLTIPTGSDVDSSVNKRKPNKGIKNVLTIKSLHQSPLGEVKAIATPGGEDDGYAIELFFPGMEPYKTSTSCKDSKKLPSVIKQWVQRLIKRFKYEVDVIINGEYRWIEASFLEYRPHQYRPDGGRWVFMRSDGFEDSITDLEKIRLKTS